MKRFLYIMLMSLMICMLTGCGDKQGTNNKNTEDITETQETEQEEEKIETYWVKGTTVNLRKEPNMDAEVICRLTKAEICVRYDAFSFLTDENGGFIRLNV